MQTVLNTSQIRVLVMRLNTCLLTFCMVCVLILVNADSVFAQGDTGQVQPPLSEHLQSMIDSEGAEAAGNWFNANWPAIKGQYSVDAQAMMAMMSGYLTAGDNASAQAVGEITSTIMQDTMADAMQAYSPEMMDEINVQRQADAKNQAEVDLNEQNNQTNNTQNNSGEPREDLNRFTGLYGPPDGRQLFVTQSCDGYLVMGAMWGDVSPWWMRSVDDSEFDYSDSFMSLNIVFSLDETGQADQLTHDLNGLSSPLSKTAVLPGDFPACSERPYR
jgi:hypothetical protein